MLDMMPFGAALMLKASDEKGRTVVSGLAPGSYSARLSGSDHWVEFDIVPLETTQVELKR